MTRLPSRAGYPVRRLATEEGQAIVLFALLLVVLIGMVGLVIDVGRLYVHHNQLKAATDAAALAAAQDVPNGTTALLTAQVEQELKAPLAKIAALEQSLDVTLRNVRDGSVQVRRREILAALLTGVALGAVSTIILTHA